MRLAEASTDLGTEDVLEMLAKHADSPDILEAKRWAREDLDEWERIGRISHDQHERYIGILAGVLKADRRSAIE